MAAPTVRAVGAIASNTTAISPGKPAGTVAGDLLLMFLEINDASITVSGWTQAPSSPQDDGANTNLLVFYVIETSGGVGTTTSDSGNHQIGRIIGITAGTFNAADPFNTSAGTTVGATTAVSIPGGTTTVDECLIVAATSGSGPDTTTTTEFSGWTNASLASITERIDNSRTAGDGGALGVATGVKTSAGIYSATTATAVTSAARGYISLAIAPVAATPATVTPAATARSLTPNAATAKGAAKTLPSTIARSMVLDAVVVKGSAKAAPSPIALAVVLAQATAVSGDAPTTVTPDPIARAFAVWAATIVGPAVVQLGANAYALVIPQATPKSPGTATPATTARSLTLPLVTVKGGSVVETGMTVTIVMPAPTPKGGSVIAPDSIDLAVVASQVTIIIGGPEDWSEQIFIDEMW